MARHTLKKKNPKHSNNNMSEYDYLFKILLVGSEPSSGKSSLLLRFAEDSFSETYISTIGVDFKIKTLPHNGKTVKLQIWDTAGQERFRTITQSYYRGAGGIFIVVDISSPTGADGLDRQWEEIDRFTTPGIPKIAVAAKADLGVDPMCIRKMNDFCDAKGITSVTCSAKNNTGVQECFEEMVRQVMRHQLMGPEDRGNDDNDEDTHKQKNNKEKTAKKTGKGFFGVAKLF